MDELIKGNSLATLELLHADSEVLEDFTCQTGFIHAAKACSQSARLTMTVVARPFCVTTTGRCVERVFSSIRQGVRGSR